MKIELILEEVFGEPPPNIVWSCTTKECQSLLDLIDRVVASNSDFDLGSELDVQLIGLTKVVLKSSESGDLLTKSSGNGELCTDLSPQFWKEVNALIKPLTNTNGFQYIEFDEDSLVEDANWILTVG